ncbi:hypothetical protein HIM_04726 [Hirsutella minnesotensis 3608]|uniref:Mpv17/PMP22 family protein n=1 Tax=Hirsutella minnesotensis 3608 TaxID=1043627 RepID=A0A0F8A156_9HYPO|nr:hypothetical protein HIM_04726 [Hirsutella minnesotensis 3608]
MTSRALLNATLQAAGLGATSNILAQLITASRDKASLDPDGESSRCRDSSCSASSARRPTSSGESLHADSPPPPPAHRLAPRQTYLEASYPAHPPPTRHPKKSDAKRQQQAPLSVRNTAIKFALDQTVGAVVNTLLFSLFIHSLQDAMAPAPRVASLPKALAYWLTPGAVDFARVDFARVLDVSLAEFWPIILAGVKVWPAVSLLNFTVVKTVSSRNLVFCIAGVAWGIYMSMVAAK